MNEKEGRFSSDPQAEAFENSSPIKRMFTSELKHLVIVAPDSMKTDPVDLKWIAENNPFACRIILLGKCMAHERFEISESLYRGLLLKLISAGVRVIHKESLQETNAKHLEVYPDAEGIPILQPKRRAEGDER